MEARGMSPVRKLWASGLLGLGLIPAGGPGLSPDPPTPTPVAAPTTRTGQVAAQEPAAQPPRRLLLDGVAAIVGEEVITHREIDYFRQLEANVGRTVEPAVILQDRVKELLKSQAGQTLVIDENLVRAQLDARWKDQVELQGGAVRTSEWLEMVGLTPPRLREIWRNSLYAQVWEENITGAGLGPRGRPKVDRFVRPGQRLAFYRILAGSPNPADRAQVGAQPERAVIQQLVLAADEFGGVEDTRTLAGELRQLAESGRSDFGDLVARYGATGTRETRGLAPPISLGDMEQLSVTRHKTRSLLDFVSQGTPGALSEPMLGWKLGADVEAIFVYKLVERLPAEEPKSPVDIELQKQLDAALLDQFDRVRLEFALREAFDSAYIWTFGQSAQSGPGGQAPGAGPGQAPGQDPGAPGQVPAEGPDPDAGQAPEGADGG